MSAQRDKQRHKRTNTEQERGGKRMTDIIVKQGGKEAMTKENSKVAWDTRNVTEQ
jgi:hypothetical protein